MLVRDYQPEDYPVLMNLWLELGLSSVERDDNKEVILQTINHGGKLILLEDPKTGTLVGSSWMTFDGRRIYLHHFGIKKEFQRQGWGLKLAQESLKYIKKQGYQVKLEVHKDNLAAKKLYEKVGFFAFTDYDIYMIRRTENIKW